MSEKLKKYVDEARKRGISDADIWSKLKAKGWKEEDIKNGDIMSPSFPVAGSGGAVSSENSNGMNNPKLMAILAYLGVLIVIPYAMAKDHPFVKFHLKQGFILFIIEVVVWFADIFIPYYFFFLIFIFPVIWLGFFILSIIGIVNVVNGEMKKLPLIGNIV